MNRYFDEVLLKVELFQDIDEDTLKDMIGCIKPKIETYQKNEIITMGGTPFTGIGIVIAGEVIITKENAVGNRVVMTKLGKGHIFGEMIAFSNVRKWPATVIALENCTIMFVEPSKILGTCEKVCDSHRTLILNMLKIVSKKALILNRKVEYLSIKSMRGKISTYLLEHYKMTGKKTFSVPLNRNELADFLNVSRPSMSREIAKMQEEGLVEYYKSSFKLLDIEGLQACTE